MLFFVNSPKPLEAFNFLYDFYNRKKTPHLRILQLCQKYFFICFLLEHRKRQKNYEIIFSIISLW